MCYLIVAVFIDDISKNRIPAILIKINIDIGHRYSIEIKEPFEEKAILYRVDVGDSEAEGNSRSGCRASSGANRHIHFAGCIKEILNDQEIPRKPHLGYHLQFKIDPVGSFFSEIAPPDFCSLVCQKP